MTNRDGWSLEFLEKTVGDLQPQFSNWSTTPETLQVDPVNDYDLDWDCMAPGLTRKMVHNFHVANHTLLCLQYQSLVSCSQDHVSLRMKTSTPWAPMNVGQCFYFDMLTCLKRRGQQTECTIYWTCVFTKETYFKGMISVILKTAMMQSFKDLRNHLDKKGLLFHGQVDVSSNLNSQSKTNVAVHHDKNDQMISAKTKIENNACTRCKYSQYYTTDYWIKKFGIFTETIISNGIYLAFGSSVLLNLYFLIH